MKDAYELFSWQDSQRLRAMQLWAALDGNDPDAQGQALLNTLTSFASTYGKPFSSGNVHFCAVLGVDSEMNRLRTAKNYYVEKLLPSVCRDQQTNDDRKHFLKAGRRYLADDPYSRMSKTINMLAYGKHIALEAGNAGNAYWSKDKSVFYLRGQPIYICRFRKMAQHKKIGLP
ncbi:hypothetical protein BU25DRAFT_456275 [Macroventuria anomochaeta]|uniref:Uncharacterized protein n=1 Tax=Macroventuria anomochaeta TaxID=301207 RepID=A0ACB6S8F8_9PLEO|nr:uncharacterized protein BU25DRAFT_456275 [Macroventuria anomochaeta]KAF2630555.1 hypothetical protein BU25DRAFT_456275 [Macroventuria anomochaeta]